MSWAAEVSCSECSLHVIGKKDTIFTMWEAEWKRPAWRFIIFSLGWAVFSLHFRSSDSRELKQELLQPGEKFSPAVVIST
jgi:hypothetical protein